MPPARARFKEDRIALSRRLGSCACGWLTIRRLPPNRHPIEHRLFSQVERSLRGQILDTPDTVRPAVQRTTTKTGLRVVAQILDKVYKTGRQCSDAFQGIKDQLIRHDEMLGKWN